MWSFFIVSLPVYDNYSISSITPAPLAQQHLQHVFIRCHCRNISLSIEMPFSLPCPTQFHTVVFSSASLHIKHYFKKSLFAAFSEKCNSFQLLLSLITKIFLLNFRTHSTSYLSSCLAFKPQQITSTFLQILLWYTTSWSQNFHVV